MNAYTVKSVARLLDLTVGQVRAYARAGFLEPERGPRGEYRFSFRDVVLLRTARGLMTPRMPARRIGTALRLLREQLPEDQPLTGVSIAVTGERVVVRDGNSVWQPETGQSCFNFDSARFLHGVSAHSRRGAKRALESSEQDADGWCALGLELEATSAARAHEAYGRALELEPNHFDTLVNLGRLLHEEGRLEDAEGHYRSALSVRPGEPTALFNLAVCLEDLGRALEAVALYLGAIRGAPEGADAYFNLARLYEELGDTAEAVRCLKAYRKLTEPR